MAELYGFRSTSYGDMGVYDSAMVCGHRVFDLFPASCDSSVLLRGYVAMSYLYHRLGEEDKVDSICNEGLRLWRPNWKATILRNSLLTNKAIAQFMLGDKAGAESSFRRILTYAKSEGNLQDIDDASANIGAVKADIGQLDSAEYYLMAALASARAGGKHGRMAIQYSNLADLAERRNAPRRAIMLLDSALIHARSANDLAQQVKIENGLRMDYEKLGDLRAALEHANERYALNDSLLNDRKVKALAEMQEKYESEKKAKEILGLRAENLQSELEKSRAKRARNIFMFTGIAILMAAGGLWNRLLFTRRSRAAIQKEKDRSEELLLNILPEEVAEELKAKGEADAKLIEHVTVLFTDFKGFTAMSEKLSPKELVRDIHECFSAFDHIIEKHGIEKIKTIGDAYMAAGGLPTPNNTHALDVVRAALEIRDFIAQGKALKVAKGLPYFEIRVGIHTGPVVAGIVGVKKFAYDIWGDTVNTASRMESSGEPGQVNISGTTHDLVKDRAELRFTHRGKVQAKGKGEMDMYFVEAA